MFAFNIKKFTVTATIISSIMTAGCDKNEKNDSFSPGNGEGDGTAIRTSNILHSGKAKEKKSLDLAVYDKTNVGIKNFDQINVSMSKSTGIPISQVASVFSDVKNSLPSENNYSLFTGSMQVSVVKLASEYCHLAFNNNELRNAILGDKSELYNLKVSETFTEANQSALMKQFANKFWGHSSNFPKGVDMNRIISSMFSELKEGRTDNVAETRKLLRATCVLYLSASPVIIL